MSFLFFGINAELDKNNTSGIFCLPKSLLVSFLLTLVHQLYILEIQSDFLQTGFFWGSLNPLHRFTLFMLDGGRLMGRRFC